MPYEPILLDSLDDVRRTEVLAMVSQAAAFDGTDPLNEAARMSLESGATTARHLVEVGPDGVEAYANLLPTGTTETVQLVVSPEARLTGIGTRMLAAALAAVPTGSSAALWSFGDLPAARGFAAANGLRAGRELLIM